MKNNYQVLIIGGGTAGIMVAAQLKLKQKNLEIAIIEPSDKHFYQPAWTLVGAGVYDYDDTIKSEAGLIPKGVDWIQDYAESFDPENNTVKTKSGGDISYEYLVVAPGIEIRLDLVEGLSETMGKNGVCSNYIDPNYTWEVLQNFKGGNAVFTQPTTPIKCGGAPQKIMYLADDYLQEKGLKNKTEVVFATAGSVIFGVTDFKLTLEGILDRKNIHFKKFYALTKIDGDNKIVYFKHAQSGTPALESSINEAENDGLIGIPFDMLHLAPPQSAPAFVRNSSLTNADGWLDVDIYSLQHKKYANVFGLGDVAALPTAKTGAAIRKQAPTVVENILSMVYHNKISKKRYDGYSSCPLVTGYGKMVLAEFKYNNVRDSDPFLSQFVDTANENFSMWVLKKYGLPYLYWNQMLKGKM